jgi:hypothetical protein
MATVVVILINPLSISLRDAIRCDVTVFFSPDGCIKQPCVMLGRDGTFQSCDSSGQLACLLFIDRFILKLCNGQYFVIRSRLVAGSGRQLLSDKMRRLVDVQRSTYVVLVHPSVLLAVVRAYGYVTDRGVNENWVL